MPVLTNPQISSSTEQTLYSVFLWGSLLILEILINFFSAISKHGIDSVRCSKVTCTLVMLTYAAIFKESSKKKVKGK